MRVLPSAAPFDGAPALTEAHGALTTGALREKRVELKSDVFRARWEGVLVVEQPGPHTFALISDDGSWLDVDGRQVIDNGGSHGMAGKDARVDLTAGPHRIRVDYAQDGGDVGLEATYTPPDGRQRLLGPALGVGATIWGRPIRPASALAIVAASWSAFVVIALVAWPLAWFARAVRRDASPAMTAAIVGLPVAVTALAAFGIGWGLPDCCGWAPDELFPAYVLRAIERRFSGGWNDLYPPAHYYLLALIQAPVVIGSRLGWFDLAALLPNTVLFVLARVASAVMAGVTAAALAMTCRVLGLSWRAALMATLVAVSMPIFVYYGRVANVDMPYVMWYALALYAYAAILARGPSVRRYVCLGAAAALSVGTKDQAWAFFPLIALHLAWRAWASTAGPAARRLVATLSDRFLWTGAGRVRARLRRDPEPAVQRGRLSRPRRVDHRRADRELPHVRSIAGGAAGPAADRADPGAVVPGLAGAGRRDRRRLDRHPAPRRPPRSPSSCCRSCPGTSASSP